MFVKKSTRGLKRQSSLPLLVETSSVVGANSRTGLSRLEHLFVSLAQPGLRGGPRPPTPGGRQSFGEHKAFLSATDVAFEGHSP